MKMYCLIVMLCRQIDDLSLNDDPIRIPKIMSVVIKLFYNRTASSSFSGSQTAMRTLPVSQVSQVNCS